MKWDVFNPSFFTVQIGQNLLYRGRRLSKEPTPIEVEMRLYEDEVNTALIQTADRNEAHRQQAGKESGGV